MSAQSCQNLSDTGHWGSNWSKKLGLEDVGQYEAQDAASVYVLSKKKLLYSAHCTVPIFTEVLFDEQKFPKVKR